MARTMRADATNIYRVVVIDSRGNKTIYGPYDSRAVARGMRTRRTRDPWGFERQSQAHIEVGDPIWTKDE